MDARHPAAGAPRLREARVEDAPALSALVLSLSRSFLADPDGPPERAAPFLASLTPEAFAARLADPDFRHLVAEAEGELAGVVALRGRSHLYHLFVAERFQGRGIGRRLWEAALGASRAAGGAERVTVSSTPAAVPVYRSFGFVAAGERREQDGIAWVPMERVEPAGRTGGGIPLLRDVFGESARAPESFARAIGPARTMALAARIGPAGRLASSVPGSPPPPHPLPRSAPASGRAPDGLPRA